MDNGIKNLCMLEVVNEFVKPFGKKVASEFDFGVRKGRLDVSDYREYCIKLLKNNGLSPEKDAHEIGQFIREVLGVILDSVRYSITGVEWVDSNTVKIYGVSQKECWS